MSGTMLLLMITDKARHLCRFYIICCIELIFHVRVIRKQNTGEVILYKRSLNKELLYFWGYINNVRFSSNLINIIYPHSLAIFYLLFSRRHVYCFSTNIYLFIEIDSLGYSYLLFLPLLRCKFFNCYSSRWPFFNIV